MFSCKFCEIFKNIFFIEQHLRWLLLQLISGPTLPFHTLWNHQKHRVIPSEIIWNTGSYPLKSSETQGHTLWNHLEHRIIPSKIVKNTGVFWCFWGCNKGTLAWNGVKANSSYPDRTKIVIQRCSVKKVILKHSQNSQENTLASISLLIKKRLWHRCFPVNFVKFLRVPFS